MGGVQGVEGGVCAVHSCGNDGARMRVCIFNNKTEEKKIKKKQNTHNNAREQFMHLNLIYKATHTHTRIYI